MADQPANGAPTEAKIIDLPRQRDTGRSAFIAAFQSGGELDGADAKQAPAAEPPKPAAAPETKPAAKPAVDEFDDDEPADEFAEDDEPAIDPSAARRVQQVQRTEAKAREQLAREKAAWEQERAALQAKAEAYDRLKARARYAPGDTLAELDPEVDWDFASKDTFARTPAAKDDPKWRDAARATSKARETDDKYSKLERQLEEMKAELRKRDESTQTERQLSSYFTSAKKAATEESAPLLWRQLAKNPDAAVEKLKAIAAEGIERTGKLPSEKTLLKVYERRRRAELEELDIDVDALVGKKKTKEQALAAAKEHAATTTTSTTATPAAGTGSANRSSRRADFVANGPE